MIEDAALRRERLVLIGVVPLLAGAAWLVLSETEREASRRTPMAPAEPVETQEEPTLVLVKPIPAGWIRLRGQVLVNGEPWDRAQVEVGGRERCLTESLLRLRSWAAGRAYEGCESRSR